MYRDNKYVSSYTDTDGESRSVYATNGLFSKRRWYKVKVPPFNYLYKLYRLYLQVCGKSPRFNFRQLHVLFSGGIHFCLGRDAKIFENYKIDPLFDADKETDI